MKMRALPASGLDRRRFLCACCAGAVVGWVPAIACAAEQVLPTRLEPHHHVRLENQYIRVLQILLDPGDATLWHEHNLDFAGVTISGAELRNETRGGGQAALIQAKAGVISWFNYEGRSYVHRILDVGSAPFVVDGFEILIANPGGFPVSERNQSPPYVMELDNSRLRAWRLKLAPGESAPPVEQGGPGFRVVLSGDRLIETVDSGRQLTSTLEPGSFSYQRPGQTRAVRNSGTVPLEIVEFELK